MVYIAPLPKSNSTRQRVSGQQQDEAQQQEQPHQPSRSSCTGAALTKKQQQDKQQQKQPERSRVSAKAGSTRRPAKTKQKHAEEQGPDPQQLLAYQAALATQVLQREQQALHILQLQQSANSLHPMVSEQHTAQHSLLAAAPHHAVAGAPRGQGPIGACEQQLHAAAGAHQHVVTPPAAQQQQKQRKQGRRQQPQPQQQQQQAHVSVLQQPAQTGQPLHAKRSQNHMFWDVAPRTINPTQVPGLTDQPAATPRPSHAGPDADSHAAAGQHQLDMHQPQPPPGRNNKQQQHSRAAAQQQSALSSYAVAGAEVRGHHQHEQSLPGALVDAAYSPTQTGPLTAGECIMQQQQQQQVSPVQRPQQQQVGQPPCSGDKAAELGQALKAAEAHPDPATRQRMIKEVKQQMYKLELEQQIAEREAARQASKAAAAAKEAAEAAARAAAPPPWDPAARLSRRGGGGEPLKGLDGAPVTDLRNQRHMLPVPGLDVSSSQCLDSAAVSPTHQPPQLHSPQHLAHSISMLTDGSQRTSPSGSHAAAAVSTSTGAAMPAAAPALSAPASFNRRGSDSMQSVPGAKCFMGSLAELRAGPSQEQRAAAAAARQQLQRDLEAQMAEKAARAEAQAAAEAARTAAEDAALQQYLQAKSTSQADVAVVGKEASMVYAAAGPLNAPAPQPAVASAATSSSGRPAVLLKGRSKRVIDAPWLDQLKPVQHSQVRTSLQDQHMQLQQQISQLHLSSHHTLPQQQSQQYIAGSSAHEAAGSSAQHAGQLWQETSSFQLGHGTVGSDGAGSGAVGCGTALTSRTHGGLPALPSLPYLGQSMNSQQLAAALQQVQQLQQEQLRMWIDFKRQAHELQQLLKDKQAMAADRDAARAELGRVQELLQQQKQLQEAYAGQQQALLDLQQQQQQFGNGRSSNQYDQGDPWEMQDCLDAFVVETQMVPISVNNIPNGDTQAVSDLSPTAAQQHGEPHSRPPAAAAPSGRNQKSRYSSFYGLEAELSTASVSSQTHSPKAVGRKARARVSGNFKPGMHTAAASTGVEHHAHSVNSSLAASTSFVPFQLSSMSYKQAQGGVCDQHQQQQDGQQGINEDHTDAAAGSPRTTHRAVQRAQKVMGASAIAAAADAAGKATASGGFAGSRGGMRSNQSSPHRVRGAGSPSRVRKNASPSKSWAH